MSTINNKKTRDFKVVDSEYIKIRHVCPYICIEEIVRKYTKTLIDCYLGCKNFFFFYIFLLWFCLLFKLHTKFNAVRLYFGSNYFLETSLR